MVSGQIYQPTLERGRRHRGIRDRVYSSRTPEAFNLERFAREKNLKTVWNYLKETGGKAPGSDNVRFEGVTGSTLFDTLRLASDSIVEGVYCPRPVREVSIRKPCGGERLLSILTVLDRVIAKAFQLATYPYWRATFPNLGRDVIDIYMRLERDVRRERKYLLAIDDIRNCFPETRVNKVLENQMSHFEGTPAEFLARQITLGHEGQALTGGMGQGSPYSPVAVESFLHHRFDSRMISHLERINSFLYRYVDNLTFLVGNCDEGNQVMTHTRQVLGAVGYRLKGVDFIDLRDQSHTTSLLGLIPKWKDGSISLEIGEDAYGKLSDTLAEAAVLDNDFNRVVKGWIQAYAPAITERVKPQVINRLRRIVLDIGETQFQEGNHLESICKGRQRWNNRRSR